MRRSLSCVLSVFNKSDVLDVIKKKDRLLVPCSPKGHVLPLFCQGSHTFLRITGWCQYSILEWNHCVQVVHSLPSSQCYRILWKFPWSALLLNLDTPIKLYSFLVRAVVSLRKLFVTSCQKAAVAIKSCVEYVCPSGMDFHTIMVKSVLKQF